MENLLIKYYNKITSDVGQIFTDPMNFVPNQHNDIEENKNALIKYFIYAGLIIGILTQSWNLIIFFLVCLVLTQIIGSKMLSIKDFIKKKHNDKFGRCRKSTIENPMGNLLLYTPVKDMDNKICRFQDKQIDSNLKYNVYYDSKDLFLKKNNIRPFITMPSQTHPNDIDKFKKYLYYFDNPTCKFNGMNCMFNEDLRYHKTDFYDKQN
jgi:hypothetical protein